MTSPAPVVLPALLLAESVPFLESPTAWVAMAWLLVFILKWVREERKSMAPGMESVAGRAVHYDQANHMAGDVGWLKEAHSRSNTAFSNQPILDRMAIQDTEDAKRHQQTISVLESIRDKLP